MENVAGLLSELISFLLDFRECQMRTLLISILFF